MNVRRYQARTMPEAMRQVREQLGPEAMILSSRRVNGMIEVVAAIEPGAKTSAAAQTRRAPVAVDPELVAMRRELKELRTLLAQQQVLSERDQWAVTHPLAASIVERLMDCGFGEKLARSLVGSLQEDQAEEEAWGRLRARLAASIAVTQPTVLDRGGVLALVGPTGAGKTTTLCRLALRRIRRLGVESVTLATLDRQRIGAYRQLQTFGQMAGVPVILLDDERDLLALAKRAAPGHLILVDTEGRPARAMAECRPFAQIRSLIPLETWLVIPATHQASVLHQVLQSFQVCAPSALVLTKIDEAERLGEVLAVLLEQQLGLVFQSDGQGLEEDFQHADTERLIRLAFGEPDVPRPQADRMRAIELPLPLGPGEARAESLPAQIPRQAPRSALILNRLGSDPLVLESVVPFRKAMHAAY
ncbi:flagellar biosynthesis protein FlhF [Caldichromatium japonicum]|uniref:Flagellar biosynthesis protein FlhF n=1 Tax=Caldichromatium japonicum TaxID=2699430 RepID=A0A6G7VFU7_9GAMM|nr:flagellar biosynthesis protein FlhF [Caldichromatium japonicum]QIK38919.1 flagellar biosynthesis protein FlhF [Caldichromatium japonicum]